MLILQTAETEKPMQSQKTFFKKHDKKIASTIKKSRETNIRKTLHAIKENFREYLKKYPTTSIKDSLTDAELQKRDFFLNDNDPTGNTFTQFYQKLTDVLVQIKQEDIQSVATENESKHFTNLLKCYHLLNSAGFHTANQKPLLFWSGQAAKLKTKEIASHYSDSDVPAICVMYELNHMIEDEEKRTGRNDLKRILAQLNTAVFANEATGVVYIYLASNKKEKSGITVGSYLWNEEYGILQRKCLQNKAQILIFLLKGKSWVGPYHPHQQGHMIPLVRRTAYQCSHLPHLVDINSQRFETEAKMVPNQGLYLSWVQTEARPQILTLSHLKKIGLKWKLSCPKAFRDQFFQGFIQPLKTLVDLSYLKKLNTPIIVEVILNSNISVDIRDEHQSTPLIYAALVGDNKLIQALLDAKADINAKNYRGDTALMTAAYEGNVSTVTQLLKSKADINAVDHNGFSSLRWAINKNRELVVDILLKAKENPLIMDRNCKRF